MVHTSMNLDNAINLEQFNYGKIMMKIFSSFTTHIKTWPTFLNFVKLSSSKLCKRKFVVLRECIIFLMELEIFFTIFGSK